MKKFAFFFFVILMLFLIIPKPAQALMQTKKDLLLQQIEILRHEIQLLRSLLLNMRQQQEISAASYLAINLSDGSFIFQKNAEQTYPIASITKLMNAVIVLEYIEKNQTITLTEKMLEPLGRSPSFYLGLKISAENLLKASLIQSTNDAAESLTYFLAKEKFLSLMNQKARGLGMNNTVFYDVHGLSPANRSSATDLSKLMAYIHQHHPEILEITKNNNFWLPDSSGRLLKFQNVNNFYPLSSFIGGKTGYLPQAKQTLVSVFRVNQEPVAIILLYSDNRQADAFAVLRLIQSKKAAP